MNNNLINFINEKMIRVDIKIQDIRKQLFILDKGLNNLDALMQFTDEELLELREILYILENSYDMLREQYKNLNIIRMYTLGLL